MRVGLPSPLQRRIGLPSRRMALYMLPVCTCFTCPKPSTRAKGCSMCRSEFNRLSAHLFAKRAHEVIADFEAWGLARLRESLAQTRAECVQRCAFVANIVFPCLTATATAAAAATTELQPLPVKDLTASRAACSIALKRLLYAPCLSPHALALARLLCDHLHAAGHAEAARIVWLYTASASVAAGQPSQQPPPAASSLPVKRAQCSASSSE